MIQHILEIRCVVRKRHFIGDVRVCGFEGEVVSHATPREGAVVAAVEVGVLGVEALFGEEVVDC